MSLPPTEILRRLGAGEPIETMCAASGWTRKDFDIWWNGELVSRLPQTPDTLSVSESGRAEILRDRWGIPHIFAPTDNALFFGYGFAMAQDRLWQMDYLRRRSMGRLAEILGPDGLALDVTARTIGLPGIARAHLSQLPAETTVLLECFAAGVNTCITQRRDRLPIEFALLDYAPDPWMALDSIAILAEFRWYLTGRLFVIALPELAKRTLQDDTLYRAFLTPEAGQESIVPVGSYTPSRPPLRARIERAGSAGADDGGSNNWAVAGSRSVTGRPLLSSDPHIAFGVTSCWHEVHLCGGSFNVAGMAYVGLPAVLLGRNERVAWGITNNICSQRDLYQERTDPQHPGCFLYDGKWEPARERVEEIVVKGEAPVKKVIRSSRHGPVVDDLLPEPARDTGPVTFRWVGADFCDELSTTLRAGRTRTSAEFREALRDWRAPTWSFAFADVDGHIAYQCVGRIPIREHWDRGYRAGWDPTQSWSGDVPYDSLPAVTDPPSGWVRSANNRTAPTDFPYPLSNTSASGHRAVRIRQMLEAQPQFSVADFARMQVDTLSVRAVEAVPPLLALLDGVADDRLRRAAEYLRSWDRRMEPDEVGAALFELFFTRWSQIVAEERFPPSTVSHMAGAVGGLALALLSDDHDRWFVREARADAAVKAFRKTVEDLQARFGPDMAGWTWGRVHTIALRHFLSGRGDLAQVLDRGGVPVRGSGTTVCNTGYDPNYSVSIGANYRLIADLSTSPPGLWAVDSAGASGDPGSPHYCNQLPEWLAGRHHYIPLDRAAIERDATSRLTLEPTRTAS